MPRRFLIAALSLIVTIAPFGTPAAHACSCITPLDEWLDDSIVTFRGRVVGARTIKDEIRIEGVPKRHEASEIEFKILERFKGPSTATYRLLYAECVAPLEKPAGGWRYACIDTCSSHGMKKGEQYVVFAFKGYSGRPSTTDCSAYSMNSPSVVPILANLRKRVSASPRTTR